jgi:hypothetical protein
MATYAPREAAKVMWQVMPGAAFQAWEEITPDHRIELTQQAAAAIRGYFAAVAADTERSPIMSIDRKESDGAPMFDLTKQPDAHTYHKPAGPIGTPTVTIIAKQAYSNDLYREHHVRIDCYDLLHSVDRARMLERAVLDALATIGVKL